MVLWRRSALGWLIAAMLVCNVGKGQIDPTGPQMLAETIRQTQLLSNVMSGIDFLEKHADKIEKAIETVEGIEVLTSLAAVYELIEDMACMSKDLNILAQQTNAYNDCLLNYQYQYPIVNLNAVGDLLDLALDPKSLIGKKDRVDAINEAAKKVNESAIQIDDLTQVMAKDYYGSTWTENRVKKRVQWMFIRRRQ